MIALTLERAATHRTGAATRRTGAATHRTEPGRGALLIEDLGGEPTLDASLSRVWEGLAAHQCVTCPLCGGEMRPDYGAHALPIGGCCASCDTRLT